MRTRCSNPNSRDYPHYGGAGIKVCPEWNSFEEFARWAISHGYDDSLSIDRIDGKGGYEPTNCRWANSVQQCRNMGSNRLLTAFGETKSLAEWVEDARCNVTRETIKSRLRYGASDEDAITRPKAEGLK